MVPEESKWETRGSKWYNAGGQNGTREDHNGTYGIKMVPKANNMVPEGSKW